VTAPKSSEGAQPRHSNSTLRRFGSAFLAAFLPGSLAGALLAGILFFLNPQLPFDTHHFLRGVLFYGCLLGLTSAIFFLLLLRANVERLWRTFPLAMTAVLLIAAIGFWVHPYYYGYYLPPGINTRLLKVATSISLAAIVCFYSIIWHRWQRRHYRPRSIALFVAMAFLAVLVTVERREAFRPTVETFRATTFEGRNRPFLCVVGVESATLDALLPLAEQGRLPFFAKILAEGARSRSLSLKPARRLPLWTTLSTGKLPYRHSVVGDHRYRALFLDEDLELRLLPAAILFDQWGFLTRQRRVDSRDSKMLPLWRILSRLGVPTATVDWPLTSPAPSEVRFVISDRFFADKTSQSEVQPSELTQKAQLFETTLDEIDPDLLARFGSPPTRSLLEALAGDLWREDLGLSLLAPQQETESLFLFLPGLREVSRRYFGGFSAVQFEGSRSADASAAAQKVIAYYSQLDGFLARLWAAKEENMWLVVVSVSGVEEANGWQSLSRLMTGKKNIEGNLEGGADGLFLFLGQGFSHGAFVRKAELVDLVPTLLYGLGFPIARDLDGNILTEVFETSFIAGQPLSFVPSYEVFAGPGKLEVQPAPARH